MTYLYRALLLSIFFVSIVETKQPSNHDYGRSTAIMQRARFKKFLAWGVHFVSSQVVKIEEKDGEDVYWLLGNEYLSGEFYHVKTSRTQQS